MTAPDPRHPTAPACVFCRIVAGDIPSRPVGADEHAVAFLDVAPWHRGHTLVVPRRHVVDLVHGEPVLEALAPLVDVVARLPVDRLGADGLTVLSSAGAVAGQEVPHAHVHLVPRYAAQPGLDRLVQHPEVTDAELDEVQAILTGPR